MDESNHSNRLPQLGGGIFLTDAGIETTLIFHRGLDLPHFAAVNLLRDETDTAELEEYFRGHAAIALDNGTGFIFEAATWRASPDWGTRLGYSPGQLDELNRRAIRMLRDLRTELQTPHSPMVVSGCIGPRGDGYDPRTTMTAEEAESYHARQVRVFAEAGADLATAITMTNTDEAVGIVRAAGDAGLPAVISFTVETDGKLPTGESLQSAVETVDRATANGPAYYMINCAHPTHFAGVLGDEDWVRRLRGLRANASRASHAELDEADVLDDGDPVELGRQYRALREQFPWLNVLGGCCGTDGRHIREICRACLEAA